MNDPPTAVDGISLCVGEEAAEPIWTYQCFTKAPTERFKRVNSPSLTLNYEDRFVVYLLPFSNLASMLVTFFGMLQQRIADVSS